MDGESPGVSESVGGLFGPFGVWVRFSGSYQEFHPPRGRAAMMAASSCVPIDQLLKHVEDVRHCLREVSKRLPKALEGDLRGETPPLSLARTEIFKSLFWRGAPDNRANSGELSSFLQIIS